MRGLSRVSPCLSAFHSLPHPLAYFYTTPLLHSTPQEVTIDPGQFRPIGALVEEETKGRGRVDVLSLKESADGDERFE